MSAVYRVKLADELIITKRQVGPLELHVDRPKGTQKTWELPDGPLTRTYPVDYGFLPGHHGEDGQPLDFFIGSDPEKGWHGSFHKRLRVYDGAKPVGFKPDETKYFAGLTPEEHAEVLKMFDGPSSGLVTSHRFFGSLPGLQGALARHKVKTAGHKIKVFEGERFKIDRPAGFVKKWDSGKEFTYPCDYGYFPKLLGEDGEGLDAFVGDDPKGHYESFLKLKPNDDGKMVSDETKFLLGVTDAERKKIYGLYGKEVSEKRVYSGMKDAMAAAQEFPGKKRFAKKAEQASVLSVAVLSKLGGLSLEPSVVADAVKNGVVPLELDERELNRIRGAVAMIKLIHGEKAAHRSNPYGQVRVGSLQHDNDEEFDAAPDFFSKKAAVYTPKEAARRGVKELRKALGTDKPIGRALADNPHAEAALRQKFGPDGLRNIMAGRDVAEVGRALGAGSEGVAYPALGRDGLGVLKVHDPSAPIYSPAAIEGKRHFIGHDNPNLAKIHYELKDRANKDGPVNSFMHEFVRGEHLNPMKLDHRLGAKRIEEAAKLPSAQRGGHAPIDVSFHNIKMQPDGTMKAVDFIGAPVSQLTPGGPRAGVLAGGFREGPSSPFIQNFNELKPWWKKPVPLKQRAHIRGQDYGEQLLRGAFGAKKQVKKDRSNSGVLSALKPDMNVRAALQRRAGKVTAPAQGFNAERLFRAPMGRIRAAFGGAKPPAAAPVAAGGGAALHAMSGALGYIRRNPGRMLLGGLAGLGLGYGGYRAATEPPLLPLQEAQR